MAGTATGTPTVNGSGARGAAGAAAGGAEAGAGAAPDAAGPPAAGPPGAAGLLAVGAALGAQASPPSAMTTSIETSGARDAARCMAPPLATGRRLPGPGRRSLTTRHRPPGAA